MTAAASMDAIIPAATQWISAPGKGYADGPASAVVDAFAAMATTPSLNWQRQLIARRFLAAFAGLDEWQRAPIGVRLAARVDVRGFAAGWAITARHLVDAAYVIAGDVLADVGEVHAAALEDRRHAAAEELLADET